MPVAASDWCLHLPFSGDERRVYEVEGLGTAVVSHSRHDRGGALKVARCR